MKINDRIMLNTDMELRVFYYNDDAKFPDHDTVLPEVGREFTIVGYVPEKSNKLRKDEESGDFENYDYVIKDDMSMELFRVCRKCMQESFVKA